MKEIRKGKILYKGMVRGRRKFLVINILLTILYIMFMLNQLPFMVGYVHGPYEFDADKFLSDTKEITIEKEIKMKKRADKTIPYYALSDISYFDGDRYRFDVKFDNIEPTNIRYTAQIENPQTGQMQELTRFSIGFAYINERKVPIIYKGEELPDITDKISGIFTEPAPVIEADISKLTANGEPVVMSEYMFDCRDVEMDNERTDIVVAVVFFALLVFLYVRLLRYYLNPYKHPTYKQLFKYGELEDVINDIEDQFLSDNIQRDGKEYLSTDWIMVKDVFKNKITKNHRTPGRYS